MTKLNTPATSSTSTTSAPPKLSFNEIAKSFTEKANAIVGKRKLAGPGLEYVNIAIIPATSHTHVHIQGPAKINPVMGLKMHQNNPQGVKCTNPICIPLPHADNHDRDHCYWSGGGMEDKALAWIHNCSKLKTETAAVTTTTTSPTTPNEVTSPTMTLRCELSCASIAELPRSSPHLSALLNSGTTSHVINDRSYFIDFTPEDHPLVRTANQGELTTFGQGTCIADVTIMLSIVLSFATAYMRPKQYLTSSLSVTCCKEDGTVSSKVPLHHLVHVVNLLTRVNTLDVFLWSGTSVSLTSTLSPNADYRPHLYLGKSQHSQTDH